jgi:glycosyltransferase XagB
MNCDGQIYKGWMQTFLVHMRHPRRSFRELGPRGFATLVVIVGGNGFVALVHPIFLAGLCWDLCFGSRSSIDIALCALSVTAGYALSVVLGWRGLSHRDMSRRLRILVWTPLHWLLLSVAGWCAAFELTHAPSRWNKTEHGLGRPQSIASTLLKLSQHIADLERRGELPKIWIDATYSAADQRRRPRVSA